MSGDKVIEALNFADLELVERAGREPKKNMAGHWLKLAACLVLVAGIAAAAGTKLRPPVREQGRDSVPEIVEEKTSATVSSATEQATVREKAEEVETSIDSPEAELDEISALLSALELGGLRLGMTGPDILAVIGEPSDVSKSGAVTGADGLIRTRWFYNLVPDSLWRSDVVLDLVDMGSGWVLDGILVQSSLDWRLSNGIGIGSSEEEVRTAFGDSVEEIVSEDNTVFSVSSGSLSLQLLTENEVVSTINLSGFVPQDEIDLSGSSAPLPYSLYSEEMTVYTPAEGGWQAFRTISGREAKKIEIILNIEELIPAEATGREPEAVLDLHNGTAVVLFGADELAMICTLPEGTDLGAETAELTGLIPLLTCILPADSWATVMKQ